ncbi:FAD-dependent oxidoreductase [Nesterenkonia populi]|uniref:FAD-dependent oxidoreductase n=1 Tax=Nesterenkonia populi TaxID=1591087 RepID=UPI0011BF50A9|nr:FAD-dependent oxidoreductase [Nesterenkonia populi]
MSPGNYDLVIVGAGAAGLTTAIEAAGGGIQTLLLESDNKVGGALHVSSGQLSAGGTRLQAQCGISDSPEEHLADVLRIADPASLHLPLVQRAVSGAPQTVDWLLDEGLEIHHSCPAFYHFHETYSKPRTYWGVDGGNSILKVLVNLLKPHIVSQQVTLSLNSRVIGIKVSRGRRVDLQVTTSNGDQTISANHVVFATGGYAANSEMFRELTIQEPVLSAAWPKADGNALTLLRREGAAIWGERIFVPTFGGVEDPPGSHRTSRSCIPALVPQERPPWEVYVDENGRRFLREDAASVHYREKALRDLRPMHFWVIFDRTIQESAPPLFPKWATQDIERAWNVHPDFVRADTLEALARRTSMPPAALTNTVSSYNRVALDGAPDEYGRVHTPQAIQSPPFFAVRNHATVLKSFAGIRVEENLKVHFSDKDSAPNIYAVGELLGGAPLSGDAFIGGMSLTPALTLGRQLGQQLTKL